MRRFPLVTLILVALNLVAYRLELTAGGQATCEAFGLIPASFMRSGEISPVFTSMFLHDPSGLSHLVGNMLFLAVFGALVESSLGGLAFLGLYLGAGALGGLAHVLVNPTAVEPLVGASGAVFGVLAVAGAMRPRLLGFVVAFVGLNVFYAFTGGDGSVSFGTHLGGFVAGFLTVLVMRLTGSEALEAA